MSIEIRNFKQMDNGTILAQFDVAFPKMGMVIRNFKLIRSARGVQFISFPSREYQDPVDGKKKYFQFLHFEPQFKKRFDDAVMALITPMLQNTPKNEDNFLDRTHLGWG